MPADLMKTDQGVPLHQQALYLTSLHLLSVAECFLVQIHSLSLLNCWQMQEATVHSQPCPSPHYLKPKWDSISGHLLKINLMWFKENKPKWKIVLSILCFAELRLIIHFWHDLTYQTSFKGFWYIINTPSFQVVLYTMDCIPQVTLDYFSWYKQEPLDQGVYQKNVSQVGYSKLLSNLERISSK